MTTIIVDKLSLPDAASRTMDGHKLYCVAVEGNISVKMTHVVNVTVLVKVVIEVDKTLEVEYTVKVVAVKGVGSVEISSVQFWPVKPSRHTLLPSQSQV